MINAKILDDNPQFKRLIDNLKNNVITEGTGIGKCNVIYDKYYLREVKNGNETKRIIEDGVYECFVIDIDNIIGDVFTSIHKDRVFIKALHLISVAFEKDKKSPDNVLKRLYQHKEIPADTITDLVLTNLTLSENTIIEIKKVFPKLKTLTINNCKILSNCYFNVLNKVDGIIIKKSVIDNMSVFSRVKIGHLLIEDTKVLKNTINHLTIDAKTIKLDKISINMPLFLINTEFPNMIVFEASKKKVMNNIDATFLTAPHLEELSFNALVTNLKFIQRHEDLEKITDAVLDVSADPNFLKLFKRKLEAKIRVLQEMEKERNQGLDKLIIDLRERYGHAGEESSNSLVNANNFVFFDLYPSISRKRFYELIKIVYDPLDFNNWIHKSKNTNISDITEELNKVDNMPYNLRQQIGKTPNMVIMTPKEGDFLDILNEVRSKNIRIDRNLYGLEEGISNSKIQDIHGNLYGRDVKDIYSYDYSIITRFEQEIELEKKEKLVKIIKEYSSTKNNVLTYLFIEFKHELERVGMSIEEKDKKEIEEKKSKPTGDICPECGSPLIYKKGRYGLFISCSNFPNCKYIKNEVTGEICPKCGKPIIIRGSRFGLYNACQTFPECNYKKPLSKEQENKRHHPHKEEIYYNLFNLYINNVLEELSKYQAIIDAFKEEDYKKIKASLPKLNEYMMHTENGEFIFMCMTYKYITGNFPSMVEKLFSSIEVPDELRKADEDGILSVVEDEEIQINYKQISKYNYSKVKRYQYKDCNDEEYYIDSDDLPF